MFFAASVAPCVFQIWNAHGANGFIFNRCRPLLAAVLGCNGGPPSVALHCPPLLHVARPGCMEGRRPLPYIARLGFMLPPWLHGAARCCPSLSALASCCRPCPHGGPPPLPLCPFLARRGFMRHSPLVNPNKNNYLYRQFKKREKNANI